MTDVKVTAEVTKMQDAAVLTTNVEVTHNVRVMLEAAYKHIKDKDFDLGVAHSGNASLVNLKDHYPKLGLVKPLGMPHKKWKNVVHHHVCNRLIMETIWENKVTIEEQHRKIKRTEEAAVAKQEENEELHRKIKRYDEAAIAKQEENEELHRKIKRYDEAAVAKQEENEEQHRKIKRYDEAVIVKQEENEEQRRKIKRLEETIHDIGYRLSLIHI